MKRERGKTAVGVILLIFYYIKDIILLGWEVSNILSFILVLICLYLILVWLRN